MIDAGTLTLFHVVCEQVTDNGYVCFTDLATSLSTSQPISGRYLERGKLEGALLSVLSLMMDNC